LLFNGGDPVATLAPEPVSTALMGGGLLLIGLSRKLRRKAWPAARRDMMTAGCRVD
jgi:hypothetical protein